MKNSVIVRTKRLNAAVVEHEIAAPAIAAKAEAGQFVILRVEEDGERIPLTIADYDRAAGTVTVILQEIGATTKKLGAKQAGDTIEDIVGPLGRATETEGIRRAAIVGGGVGCAIAYPVAKKLHESGAEVDSIIGFRNQDLVILEDKFRKVSRETRVMTDDGSYGEKGLVTDALRALIESGRAYDEVFAIGPLVMMKFVSRLTAEYGIKTTVSMNPIMIDGTGMCGGCRVTVGGKMCFACVDGPDFDGHAVDYDEAIARLGMYKDFERKAYEETCNLLAKADGAAE